jgi:hypothetical protein
MVVMGDSAEARHIHGGKVDLVVVVVLVGQVVVEEDTPEEGGSRRSGTPVTTRQMVVEVVPITLEPISQIALPAPKATPRSYSCIKTDV